MVRFKNRYLLVEFLTPSALESSLSSTLTSATSTLLNHPAEPNEETDDDEDEFALAPSLPFLIPTTLSNVKLGDEGQSVIYKAIRGVVQDVFGDEGWGRLASSFKVIYYSPLTTLTFLRIARGHYRLLWSALTFLATLNSVPVIPRVLAVSGTIRKLQNRGIRYHRRLIAEVLAAGVGLTVGKVADREREEMGRVGD